MFDPVSHTVLIEAPPERVWMTLTNIREMIAWMAEPEMQLEIDTNWIVGESITIRGFHHAHFENRGLVRQFAPPYHLEYSQLSSISGLADTPENHSIFEFRLDPVGGRTSLTITLRNFPTESIFRHLDFYWRVTVGLLKKFVEEKEPSLR